jgi:Tfp pilus assembly protein PilO
MNIFTNIYASKMFLLILAVVLLILLIAYSIILAYNLEDLDLTREFENDVSARTYSGLASSTEQRSVNLYN